MYAVDSKPGLRRTIFIHAGVQLALAIYENFLKDPIKTPTLIPYLVKGFFITHIAAQDSAVYAACIPGMAHRMFPPDTVPPAKFANAASQWQTP